MVHYVCETRGFWQRGQLHPLDVLWEDCFEGNLAGRFGLIHFLLSSLQKIESPVSAF
jgi:hypothetical protein